MYSVGDYIVHPGQGVCRVEGLVSEPVEAYRLLPIGIHHPTFIRFPVANAGKLRPVLTYKEAMELIEEYPDMQVDDYTDKSNALEEEHFKQEIRQGFIAMSFGEETRSIREAFRQAITEAGYAVRIIDEKEHNNQIVPEIFYEIQRSKFVVVGVSVPNYGAYYEAGYAQALGKQVIICCREAEFHEKDKRPHFDIAQKSMIVWTDEEDLIARLKRRIEATVG